MTEVANKAGLRESPPSSSEAEPASAGSGVKPLDRAMVFVVRDLLVDASVEEVVTRACLRADQLDMYVGRSVWVAERKYRRMRLEEALDYARLFDIKALFIPDLEHINDLLGIVTLVCDLIVLNPEKRYRKTPPVRYGLVRPEGTAHGDS